MTEHVTADECLEWAVQLLSCGLDDISDMARACAATIEALQAQLAAKPPASADTSAARLHAGTLRGTKEGRLLHQIADALDASRAECERLRATSWTMLGEGMPEDCQRVMLLVIDGDAEIPLRWAEFGARRGDRWIDDTGTDFADREDCEHCVIAWSYLPELPALGAGQ